VPKFIEPSCVVFVIYSLKIINVSFQKIDMNIFQKNVNLQNKLISKNEANLHIKLSELGKNIMKFQKNSELPKIDV
jgi:hypothetical protein